MKSSIIHTITTMIFSISENFGGLEQHEVHWGQVGYQQRRPERLQTRQQCALQGKLAVWQ